MGDDRSDWLFPDPPRAVDRNELPSTTEDDAKTSRFPRTTRRQERVRSVLARRQSTLTIVLEDVHDPHNASAALRSCDAVVHLVYVNEEAPRKSFNRTTSSSAAKWVRTHFHETIEDCYASLRAQGFRILATALREDTRDLYRVDLTEPVALVFGNEKRGVSNRAVDLADGTVGIPMQGMVESLNISVACAVSLYEAMRQRTVAGIYRTPQLSIEELESLEAEWIRR
jgi:tRNA (guanosine-2'-O-)-methyltransferase